MKIGTSCVRFVRSCFSSISSLSLGLNLNSSPGLSLNFTTNAKLSSICFARRVWAASLRGSATKRVGIKYLSGAELAEQLTKWLNWLNNLEPQICRAQSSKVERAKVCALSAWFAFEREETFGAKRGKVGEEKRREENWRRKGKCSLRKSEHPTFALFASSRSAHCTWRLIWNFQIGRHKRRAKTKTRTRARTKTKTSALIM